jgi:CHAT domain-containing protein/Tfp pilus assembly protein PilF
MRLLTFGLALTTCALGLAAPEPDKPAAPLRELSKADAEWASKKHDEAVKFGREGKYEEAQGPIREILDLVVSKLGKDHYAVGDWRREIEALKQLAALPSADRDEYKKTYKLADEMNDLWKKACYADALRPAEQILDIYRRLLGPESVYVAIAANNYGLLLHRNARYADAETQFRGALKLVRQVVGEEHPYTASLCGNLAQSLERQDKYDEARDLLQTDVKITTRLRGEKNPATAVAYNNLACGLELMADYREAERLHRKAEAILRAAAGEDNKLATTCNNLALNLQHQARYDEAEALYEEAIKLRVNVLGKDHPETGEVYMNLATLYDAQGDVAKAEPLYHETVRTYEKAYGPKHPYTGWALNNLAFNLDRQMKFEEAERRYRDALAIMERAPATQSQAVAKLSNNLASCLQGQEKYEEAEELCAKALRVLRERLGPNHPDVAVAVNNMAYQLDAREKYAEAERLFREALAILDRRYGAAHPETAEARDNLAVNLYHQCQFEEAERLFKESLAAQRRVLGEGHPSTARTYKFLLLNCCARGDHTQAAGLASAAAKSFEAAHRRLTFAGLDRARRAAEFSPYPALATVYARRDKPYDAWQALEQNLGRGLLDDVSARPVTADERGREQELLARLDLCDRQVAALPADKGTDAEPKAAALLRQRDAAQADLVSYQADLAKRYGPAAGEVYSLRRIQAQLPEDAALLAWVDLDDLDKRADAKGDHWACLVRRKGAPVWVRLPGTGADGAWTGDDDRLVGRVRRAFAVRPGQADVQWRELAGRLHRQRLEPLADAMRRGADLPRVRHLIVLPSHHMRRIPLEALIDGFTVSYTPSGSMFAWLQEHRPAAGREAPPKNLLALGAPEFPPVRDDGAPSKATGPGDKREAFTELPGARQEIAGLARIFDKTELLMGPAASERNLDRLLASGDLRTFPYLHFATHGVFDDQRPMRSALILTGGPPPEPLRDVLKGKPTAEGRLTAERILRGWKLDAELVTLSACDSGLGRYAGGEGYLGFSQALFVAGARSVVVSLWPVDDRATALLMTRFYENLLGTPEKSVRPMPKAEALTEAKHWLRRLRPDEVDRLTKDLPTRGTRGRVEPRQAGTGPAEVHSYEHPYFWSGFILSGDPR